MVTLQSSLVSANDDTDPYLCRYNVPDADKAKPADLVSLKWHGFASPKWVTQVFITLLYVLRPGSGYLFFLVNAH